MNKLLTFSMALMAVALSLLASPGAAAYELTWTDHDLNFSVPDGGQVMVNTPTRFQIAYDEMYISIHLFKKDAQNRKERYTQSLQSMAAGYNMYNVSSGKVKVKNFDGYQVEGTMPNGTRMLLTNLVSKKVDLLVQIEVEYLFGNRETVDDFIKSFSINKDQRANHEKKHQRVQSPGGVVHKPSKKELEEQKKAEEQRQFEEKKQRGELKEI